MTSPLRSNPERRTVPDSPPFPRPVKVLIVDTAIAFGGSLAVTRNLLKHLDANVVDASLVSACSDGFVSDGFAGNTEIRLLAPKIDYVILEKWKSAIQKRFRWVPLRRSLQLSAMVAEIAVNLPYLVRLLRLYRKLGLDVVHLNNYRMEPLLAARLLAIPVIYQLHGVLPNPLDGSMRRDFRHVKVFVSITQAVTESAVRIGIDHARVRLIPNFAESAPAGPPSPLPADPAIGILGRVNHWKGQKEFLRATMRVLPHFPRLRIYIVGDVSDGDPTYFNECREIVRTSPYADQIEFTGMVTDVAAYYRKCTTIVLASIGAEGFPMVLIEAMAHARPVIASTIGIGATSEIVQNGVEGFLVDPHDTCALADCMLRLLSDPALATRMGLNGYEKVRTHYAPDAAARRFERLYLEIAGTKTDSPQ